MTEMTNDILPAGIQAITRLPNSSLRNLWQSIFISDDVRQKLVAQAVLNFTARPKIGREVLPLHGVILLAGPPGTGKTSLAKGLANEVCEIFGRDDFQMVEVEPHGLTSSGMGKTQRAVAQLFAQTISELASTGPTVVVLDEVETLAVDRSKLSLDANPVDIHRATDAVLVQLDLLAEAHKNLLFIATSNFPQAVDDAFVSRCDLVIDVPLPNADGCRQILEDCLTGLKKTYPKVGRLLADPDFDETARKFVGLDGRAIRKTVANALASDRKVAMDPGSVSISQLSAAADAAKTAKSRDRDIK